MATEESRIVKSIAKWLSKQDCEFYKVHGSVFQRSGEPDIQGSIRYKGIVIHFNIEVKTKEGKVSRIQMERLRAWSKFERLAIVVTSVKSLKWYLDKYVEMKLLGGSANDKKWREIMEASIRFN